METRMMVVTEEGSFVTIGRHSEPTADDIARADSAMRFQAKAGWLVRCKGNPYQGPIPQLEMLQPVGDGAAATFETAAARFRAVCESYRREG